MEITAPNIVSLYKDKIGVQDPWKIREIDRDEKTGKTTVQIEYASGYNLLCPKCKQNCKRYDNRPREVREIKIHRQKTLLKVYVPRVKCEKDGVQQLPNPFVRGKYSRFTIQFEDSVIAYLENNSIKMAAEEFSLSWDIVDGILQRAEKSGRTQRKRGRPTSYQKRSSNLIVVVDAEYR